MKFLQSIFKRNMSIKTRLLVVSFILLSVPVTILGLIGYSKTKSALDEQGEIRLKTSVEMTIDMIETLNDEVKSGDLSLADAQEKIKTLILGAKDNNGLRPANEKIDLGENGYLFILEQDGNAIAHPNDEGEAMYDAVDENGVKFIQEMIQSGNNGGGFTYYRWELPNGESRVEQKVTYSQTDPHWNWVVSGSTYMSDFNKSAKDILNAVIIIIVVTLLVGITIIWIFATRIANPIQRVTAYMDVVASGDLTSEPLEVRSKDETGQLSMTVNHMNEELRSIISNVSDASQMMASGSEELTQAAHEVSEGSDQVATTMQELAAGAESQAHSATDLSTICINDFDEQSIKKLYYYVNQIEHQFLNMNPYINLSEIVSIYSKKMIEISFDLYDNRMNKFNEKVRSELHQSKRIFIITYIIQIVITILISYSIIDYYFSLRRMIRQERKEGFLFGYQSLFPQFKQVEHKYEKTKKKLAEIEKLMPKKVMNAYEEERKRVSRELHDSIGQYLYTILVKISIIEKTLPKDHIKNNVEQLKDILEQTIKETREIAHALRPGILDDLGLMPALQSYVRNYMLTHQIHVSLQYDGNKERLNAEVEINLYRICQEALTNISKHAEATDILITIVVTNRKIELSIIDNGIGFQLQKEFPSDKYGGIGLFSMKERAELLHGTFNIFSSKSGTKIVVTIPRQHQYFESIS